MTESSPSPETPTDAESSADGRGGDGTVLVSLQHVTKRYDGEAVLDDLSLDVPTGETTVILGQSGSGKSVLLKHMNGLLRPDEGRVLLFGQDITRMSERKLTQLRRRTGMVLQNYALIDSIDVLANVCFPLVENTDMPRDAIEAKAMELLTMLGIAEAARRLPSELSGGMKKRVSFARAVITEPELVLFDEPTTGLDPVMIEFVDALIIQMRERFNLTSVIVSHDIGSVFRLADKIAMLQGGRIVEYGTPAEIKASTHPDVVRFIGVGGSGRLASGREREERRGLDPTSTAPQTGEDVAEGDREGTEPTEDPTHTPPRTGGDVAEGDREGTEPTEDPTHTPPRTGGDVAEGDRGGEVTREPIVVVRELHKKFGTNHVLRGINLELYPREISVIIGGSGSGKSVLMKHILGLFRPTSGSLRVLGQELNELSERELQRLRTRVGMLFQGAALFDSMRVRDNIAFPMVERGQRRSKREVDEAVDDVLERLHLKDIARAWPSDISAGQRKRVGLARAIVTRPEIMIYDEPTTGQDPIMIKYVDDMIVEAHETFELTSLVISHDMQSTFRIADRIAMLYLGEIAAAGTPEEVMASERAEVQRFIFAGTESG